MPFTSAPLRGTLLIASATAVGVAALIQAVVQGMPAPGKVLLAPMIGLAEPCILLPEAPAGASPGSLESRCTGPDGSAAALVEATLAGFQPPGTPQRYPVGYTLNVPLLQLFKQNEGGWVIDANRVGRLVRTIRDNERPVVLYLFSTHFATGAPIEEALASDPENLGHTRDGPLPRGTYHGSAIHNWSLAGTGNSITARRVEAINAVLDQVCRLDERHVARIRAVTLLGEVHHLFPDFESGMGFLGPYRVSDHSEASRKGFREYLENRFRSIEAFNQAMGSSWSAFTQVEPPSRDVRREPLREFTEHIDSFAHGTLPIAGWVHIDRSGHRPPPRVSIYLNGTWIATTTATLGRQDVLEARPELGDANTGWRFDLDYRRLPPGLHRIDVYLEGEQDTRMHLGTRQVAIMDRQQATPVLQAQKAPPPVTEPGPGPAVSFHLDLPAELSSYFYNPLVEHWHAFRGQQVVDYLQFFNRIVSRSCLRNTPRYTHQIIPFTNPGWDSNKFAIDASLAPLDDLRLGVSLYGEASYGNSFAQWLKGRSHQEYGVTEFHPLKRLNAAELRAVLDTHARQGARFVSFFLEPRFRGKLVPRGHNILSLDPENQRFGSDVLYRSMAEAAARERSPGMSSGAPSLTPADAQPGGAR